jgi:hypothetical protein
MRYTTLFIAALSIFAIGGCNGEETEQEPFNICDNFDTEYEDIQQGLTKDGENGLIEVKYVSSTPAPPAEGDNSWTVQLMDDSGTPLSDGAVTEVKPWMPDHGHGTQVEPSMSDMDTDGMVDVDNIDFRMPGVWTLTFTVETGGQVDTATFNVCIN